MNSPELSAGSPAAARRQGQARLRAVTVTVGVVGLVGAGVTAFALPGSTHNTSTATASGGSSGSSSASSSAGSSPGSGSSSGTGSSSGSSSSSSQQPGISPSQGSGQTTSGGS